MTTPTEPAPATPAAPTTPEPPTDPAAAAMTTDAGKKALDELRQQNKELAAQLKGLEGLKALEPLKDLAAALGVKPDGKSGQTDVQALTEQIAAMKKQQADAELRAMRLEVAAEKGLTVQQAARLSGSTREELATDADTLKALFPGTSTTPGTPKPDPTQGSRGSASDMEARLAKAVADKDVAEQIRLKTALAATKSQ